MKLFLTGFLLLLVSITAVAQNTDSTKTKGNLSLGEGLQFSANNNQYQFKIAGMIQPNYSYTKTDRVDYTNKLRSKRTYLSFTAKALKEKVTFFVQTDFSAATPLLDAYIGYGVAKNWVVSVGQRRTFTNNREMTFNENDLQFVNRGYSSTLFTNTGREFGLFVEGKIGTGFVLVPQLAVTSGDGANSFGANSTDVDKGGIKYGGRLDIYPMGEFSAGNRGMAADLKRESKPKILIGASASLNKGASEAKGEGHGVFLFYDKYKDEQFPDLRKVHADFLLKYKGFSLLGEFVNASASNLNGIYLDSSAAAGAKLVPTQISQYLVLGNAWNVQVGYVFKGGFALSARYEDIKPEFGSNANSILKKSKVKTFGICKYFNNNALKLQTDVSMIKYTTGINSYQAELMLQIAF